MTIRQNSKILLINVDLIDKRNYFVDIVFRFRAFRRRYVVWEIYFVFVTIVFDFRKRHVLNCSIYQLKKNEIFFRTQICFQNYHAFFMINLLHETFCFFVVVWRKKEEFSLFEINNKWWSDFWRFFSFVFVIFLIFYSFFDFPINL